MELPYPPPEFRALVGPTELEAYDNPEEDWVWGALEIPPLEPGECYRRVFDFGCGCAWRGDPPSKTSLPDSSRVLTCWASRDEAAVALQSEARTSS